MTALETIGPDRVSSVCSQSLTEESGVGEESINPIGHDSSATVWPQFQQHERAVVGRAGACLGNPTPSH